MKDTTTVHEPCSRSKPLGVPREHRGLPDIVEPQVQHADSLQANAASAVRGTPVPEGVNEGADRLKVNAVHLGTLNQEVGVVNSFEPSVCPSIQLFYAAV